MHLDVCNAQRYVCKAQRYVAVGRFALEVGEGEWGARGYLAARGGSTVQEAENDGRAVVEDVKGDDTCRRVGCTSWACGG
jgi:hypothetical protein